MIHLEVDGAALAYRTSGTGPALLAPECNYSWTPEVEALMAEHFTLVVATPRDYGTSSRPGAPYDPHVWASDMLAVMTHLGHESFAVFGYSFTGAFGPWLALELAEHDAVTAVVSGGFPLLGDYGITSRDVDEQMAEMEKDEDLWSELSTRFDLRAGAAFYERLATLPPDALVDRSPCPLYCFWGDQDVDAVEMVMPHAELADGLTRRGVDWKQYPGMDHEGLNADLATAWPDAKEWLLAHAVSTAR
jgi:pimeloyl-ACP methyl ester carboxylesterase